MKTKLQGYIVFFSGLAGIAIMFAMAVFYMRLPRSVFGGVC